jgi:hypothetical protein
MNKVDYSSGAYDWNLIRWANVSADVGPNPEEWKPEITNSAGFLRVKQGSGIVTGFITRQEVLIFTDISSYYSTIYRYSGGVFTTGNINGD